MDEYDKELIKELAVALVRPLIACAGVLLLLYGYLYTL